MFKKVLGASFLCLFPFFAGVSCSGSSESNQAQEVVKVTYDFSYQSPEKEELEEYFSNFYEETLFIVEIKNFNYEDSVFQTGYANDKKTIDWPGEENLINIIDWIVKMSELTPLGS